MQGLELSRRFYVAGAIDAGSDNTVLLERPANWQEPAARYDRG